MSDHHTWTVSVIAVQDKEHTEEYEALERSILHQGANENISYAIFHYQPEDQLVQIKKLNQIGSSTFDKVPSYNGNIYEIETLVNFFKDHVAKPDAGPFHHNMVITWGHGTGLGFFGTLANLSQQEILESTDINPTEKEYFSTLNKKVQLLNILQSNLSIKGTENHVLLANDFLPSPEIKYAWDKSATLFDEISAQTYDYITADELSTIIQKGLNKIDILICTNCFMQMFDTGYALRNTVNIMVAAQTSIPFDGIYHEKLFALLFEFPETTPEDIAKHITNYFPVRYLERQPLHSELKINDISISANKLIEYKNLAPLIKEFVTKYITFKNNEVRCEKKLQEYVILARDICYDLTSYESAGIVDLTHFFYVLASFIEEGWFGNIKKTLIDFLEVRQTCNISIYSPVELTIHSIIRPLSSRSPKFLSIFMPSNSNSPISDFIRGQYIRKKYSDSFLKDTDWDIFLEQLYH